MRVILTAVPAGMSPKPYGSVVSCSRFSNMARIAAEKTTVKLFIGSNLGFFRDFLQV
jgi:hypothetical protein